MFLSEVEIRNVLERDELLLLFYTLYTYVEKLWKEGLCKFSSSIRFSLAFVRLFSIKTLQSIAIFHQVSWIKFLVAKTTSNYILTQSVTQWCFRRFSIVSKVLKFGLIIPNITYNYKVGHVKKQKDSIEISWILKKN